MQKASVVLDRDFAIGEVDRRLYGSFIEHLGRAVYGGIYEPGHPAANAQGFRRDVLDLVRRLRVPLVRYPGGNFVSGFRWEDAIGPKETRPRRLDLAWATTETNEVGLHEFCDWAAQAGAGVMYAVNLGTRGPEEARQVVEYANHPGGTYWSDLRVRNGARDPFGIQLWCLGNEMDGPWQMGRKTAYEYGRVAAEAAKLMKWTDPAIELVACGSSYQAMPTFGDWEAQVLDLCYDQVDYLSLHQYYGNAAHDSPSFLARGLEMEAFIGTVVSICDYVGGKKNMEKNSKKKLHLSFDEWNVWYHSNARDEELQRTRRWETRLPLLEDVYNFEDALLVGTLLNALLRNADRVKIACLAQLVNVIAPIMTRDGGGAWAQTIYWPFLYASIYGQGISLRPVVQSPAYDCAAFDQVPCVDAAATLREDGSVALFLVNRSLEEDIAADLDLRAFGQLDRARHVSLHHPDLQAVNTLEAPDTVSPTEEDLRMAEGRLSVALPRQSWHLFLLSGEQA